MRTADSYKGERLLVKTLFVFCYLVFFSSCHNSGNHLSRFSPPAGRELQEYVVADPDPGIPETDFNTEEYAVIKENDYRKTIAHPLSTFSIDVDKASYANVRRFLNQDQLPPPGSVRIEELINYFDYQYPEPDGGDPFSITTELSTCPWNETHQLFRIGLKGKTRLSDEQRKSNLVFLIDVSGSMGDTNKLPLVKKSLAILVENLAGDDLVSIVVYAGKAGVVLQSARGSEKEKIMTAINSLAANGSTAGGTGIELAYQIARENFIDGGNNRIILATDGDFNVGISSTASLVDLLQVYRKNGVYLTICGYGMGNYKDYRMEEISNAGNGNYFYIDNILEANKVFAHDLLANMFSIAKDVKVQVEFNPGRVGAYRLIGYENRKLENTDFANDSKDAGELGAGHTVTALYEIMPPGTDTLEGEGPLKYQRSEVLNSKDLATIKFRYKAPDSDESTLIEKTVDEEANPFERSSEDMRFASAVASFAMLLRNSEYKGMASYDMVMAIAENSDEYDKYGYKSEFLSLVNKAKLLNVQP